jgi:curli biogenesis system outer membrane secretion channel CsgG
MKKLLVVAAALALAASPVAAQEAASPVDGVQAQSAVASGTASPSIFVSQDEIRQRVAAAEAEREGAQIGSTSWWYTVLAVALGVVIAVLLLDN